MDDSRLQLNGSVTQFLEIGGEDLGTAGATSENFGIGELTVGTDQQATVVRLAEVHNNGNRGIDAPEALYLFGIAGEDGLRIVGGSTLVLDGYNVYAQLGGQMTHLNALFGPGDEILPFDGEFLALEPIGPLPGVGDMDIDGDVDFDDISQFVLALIDPVDYLLAHDELGTTAGDTDGDGDLDFDDIAGFVLILGGTPTTSRAAPLPEPSTRLLLLLGGAVVWTFASASTRRFGPASLRRNGGQAQRWPRVPVRRPGRPIYLAAARSAAWAAARRAIGTRNGLQET